MQNPRFGLCFLLFSVATVVTLPSCQTAKKRSAPPSLPPISTETMDPSRADKILKEEDKKQKTHLTTWLTTYRRGQIWKKSDPQFSCSLFMTLVNEDQFILQGLAAIHAVETCPVDHPQLEQALAKLPKDKAHLKEPALRAELAWARKKKSKATWFAAAMDLSKEITNRDEKVELVREAKKIAPAPDLRKSASTRLYDLAPRFLPDPPFDKLMSVAFDYRRARQFTKARATYQSIHDNPKSTFMQQFEAMQGIRQTYKLERNKPKHKEYSRRVARMARDNWKKTPKNKSAVDLFLDSFLQHARNLWTMGLVKETTINLEQVEKNLTGKQSLHELYWIRGRMMEEQQKFAEATEWFEKALKEPGLSPNMKERVQWYLGWNYRKLQKFEEAAKLFDELKDSTESSTAKSKYAYWLADVLYTQKKESRAQSLLEDIIDDDPLSYYRILASRRLKKPIRMSWAVDAMNSSPSHDLGSLFDSIYFEWLMATEEFRVAGNYLNEVFRKLRVEKKDSDQNKEYLIRQYARSRNFLHLFARMGELEANKRHSLFRSSAVFVFPTPFEPLVKAASARTEVPAALLYSIMRQESSFDPEARSPADAFGLMQVLPEVAQKTAQANGLKLDGPDDLFEPDVSIPIGAFFLKKLSDHYAGHFIQTVASYNASEEAIAGWINTRYKGDTLMFIEDIPYEETQGYVKLVMRNFVFYSLILSGKKEWSFQESLLELKLN